MGQHIDAIEFRALQEKLLRYLSIGNNVGFHWLCFTMLWDWSEKLAPPS